MRTAGAGTGRTAPRSSRLSGSEVAMTSGGQGRLPWWKASIDDAGCRIR